MAMERPKNNVWQLQEAKAMLSEVVKASKSGPQFITVHGKETAVILSMENYKKLIRPKQTLYEFIRNSPLYGVELELPDRSLDVMREVDL